MLIRTLAFLATASAATVAMATTAPPTTVIYDATGGAENGGDSFASGGKILLDQVQNVTAGALDIVTLNLEATKSDLGKFNVVVVPLNRNGTPRFSQLLVVGTVADSSLGKTFSLVSVNVTSEVSLAANTPYYVGIERVSGAHSSVVLGNTVDPSVLSRPTVEAGQNYYNNGGIQANSGGPYEIKVVTTPND